MNNDLSAIGKYYKGIKDYRRLYNHISHCLWEIKHGIPNQVKDKTFESGIINYL